MNIYGVQLYAVFELQCLSHTVGIFPFEWIKSKTLGNINYNIKLEFPNLYIENIDTYQCATNMRMKYLKKAPLLKRHEGKYWYIKHFKMHEFVCMQTP